MHYVHSNEWTHQVWKPYIENVRGAYVGVGTDQGFTMVAWARSELAFLMDYDPEVVRVNYAHRALIEHSPDIATYLARFQPKGKAEAVKLLETEYATHPDRAGIIHAFSAYRGTIAAYYKTVSRRAKLKNHFLHDPAGYEYLRQLAAGDRIRVLRGDLLKDKSLKGIGTITHALKVPMRVVYMSNAEEFWPYPRATRESYAAMLWDEKSAVLRTRHTDIYGPRIDAYVYIVEDGTDFATKIQEKNAKGGWKYSGIWSLMADRKPAPERKGLFTIGPVEKSTPVAPAP
jgi:hypothetical protein